MKQRKILLLTGMLWLLGVDIHAQQLPDIINSLDSKQQSIIPIAAFAAKGDLVSLKQSLHDGLDAGLSINETKEVLVHLYAYAGFPRSLNAISTLEAVVNDRKQKGIDDIEGKQVSVVIETKSKFDVGKDALIKLTGSTATGAPQQFVPIIDTFLKEHLFADIFRRDVLDWKIREIVTISVLASLDGTENQLRSHFRVGLNTGLTEQQLKTIAVLLQKKVGAKEGSTADRVLQAVLNKTEIISSTANHTAEENLIFPKGTKITNDNFFGNAWLYMSVQADSLNQTAVGSVTFEPGARTKWHLHPAGQILVATGGVGYYQEKGSPKRFLRKGDVVKCPPNVPHWHGASRDEEFIQIAITSSQNGPTVWLQPVAEEEYNSHPIQ